MATTITYPQASLVEVALSNLCRELFDFNTALVTSSLKEDVCTRDMHRLNSLDWQVSAGDVLLFDMDGTLIDTDACNTKAYKAAIEVVLGGDYAELLDISRIERRVLRERLSWISEKQLADIIALKEKFYTQFIDDIRIIPSTMEILNRFGETHKVVLVTNARRGRTMQTLRHLHLENSFDAIVTKDDCNGCDKFTAAISRLNLKAQDVWVFENEEVQAMAAVAAGININHIILR